jgi:hypothetical protein
MRQGTQGSTHFRPATAPTLLDKVPLSRLLRRFTNLRGDEAIQGHGRIGESTSKGERGSASAGAEAHLSPVAKDIAGERVPCRRLL